MFHRQAENENNIFSDPYRQTKLQLLDKFKENSEELYLDLLESIKISDGMPNWPKHIDFNKGI